MKNIKIRIISIIILLLIISGVGGFFVYQKVEEEKIAEKEISKITKTANSFSKSTKHEEKLTILKTITDEMNNYVKTDNSIEQVANKYKSVISDMQTYFKQEYDTNIKENTLENLDTLEDIDTITKSNENLTSLLSSIETEKEYVFSSSKDFENYNKKITQLSESYTNRISELEEAKKKREEEEKRKAEEEAKRIAEEKAKTHYENEYFSVDVPQEWAGNWGISEGENTLQPDNPRVIAVYGASYNPGGDGYGGGAIIHVLKREDFDRLGAGYFSMPASAECITQNASAENFVFIMTQAGASFFKDGGATITAK